MLCIGGCGEEDSIRVYDAPKEPPPGVTPPHEHQEPPIAWRVPAGWTELPSSGPDQFGRFATIQVAQDDPTLTLNVNLVSSADPLTNLNRWEGQLGLPPTPVNDLQTKVRTIEVEAHSAHRIDLTGTSPDTKAPQRMLAVLLPDGDRAWSFLLKGPPDKVAAQEKNFDAFLATVHFPGHNHGASGDTDAHASTQPAEPSADNKTYTLAGYNLPAGWERDTGAQPDMRFATFFVGSGNERAELRVSRLPRNGYGSIENNLTRWRGEVGLPPVSDVRGERMQEATVGGAKTIVFDFVGPDNFAAGAKRSYVALLFKGAHVWFFKLLGPVKTVTEQRASFDAFLQSLKFGEAGE